jgi:site-specific recombinase XerD
VSFFRQSCLGRGGEDTIFLKKDGTQWQTSHQIRRMKEACSRAKIAPAMGFHGLRHTYASLHIKNGAKLHIVALNLGHITKDGQPDVRMVTRHYAHLEATDIADAVRKTAPTFGLENTKVRPLTPKAA